MVNSTNPEKAASRVAINGVMLASIFVMLAVIFLEAEKFNNLAIIQIVLAIPLLFESSLAYSKVGYWKSVKLWDLFGYFTNILGNLFMINAMGLIAYGFSHTLAFLYFGLVIFLSLIYSLINMLYTHKESGWKQARWRLFKFLFSTLIIFFGGILPTLIYSL